MDQEKRGAEMEDAIDAFSTRHRSRDQKRLAVLTAAAELFLTRGYHRTRMDDVAGRLNITKPALYNYFKSKHEVLFGCHMLGHDLIDAKLVGIDASAGEGLDRLRALIHAYAEIMTQPFGMCMVLLEEHDLIADDRQVVRDRRRSVNASFERFIVAGIADGSVRAADVRLTAFAIAGALNWIPRWFKPGMRMNGAQLVERFAASLTEGIAALRA